MPSQNQKQMLNSNEEWNFDKIKLMQSAKNLVLQSKHNFYKVTKTAEENLLKTFIILWCRGIKLIGNQLYDWVLKILVKKLLTREKIEECPCMLGKISKYGGEG